MPDCSNYVCLVTGATRGIGKAIALGLANLGATIYITGRSSKPKTDGVGGSLEETAREINARGGKAISVAVDHSDDAQVEKLFEQISREQNGRLDVLINNVYSAIYFLMENFKKPYYEITQYSPGEAWDMVNNVGLRNYYICAVYATRLMAECRRKLDGPTNCGLIVNISSMGGKRYVHNALYGIGKSALDRMVSDMHRELKMNKLNICFISLWPGMVRTEELLSASQEGSSVKPLFEVNPEWTESPDLVGQALQTLVSEPTGQLMKRSGQIVLVCDVARQYGLREPDGRTPPDYRSLGLLLRLVGFERLYQIIPAFVRLPHFLYWYVVQMGAD